MLQTRGGELRAEGNRETLEIVHLSNIRLPLIIDRSPWGNQRLNARQHADLTHPLNAQGTVFDHQLLQLVTIAQELEPIGNRTLCHVQFFQADTLADELKPPPRQ